MKCTGCSVPPERSCLAETPRFASFCEWAESGDPVKRAHVANRSVIAEGKDLAGVAMGSFPPLRDQAGNLTRAVGRFVAGGLARANPVLKAERLSICGGCEQFSDGRCRLCGCGLALKASLAAESCPIRKWPASTAL